jgi:cell division protein FtsB
LSGVAGNETNATRFCTEKKMQPHAQTFCLSSKKKCKQPNRLSKGEIMSDMGIQPVAASAAGLSPMERVTSTFSAPSKTFEDIKRGNRSWWLPFVILSIVGYIFFAAVSYKVGMQTVVDNQFKLMSEKQQEQMAQAPPAQREMSAKISLYVTEGVFIAGPIFLLVVAAVVSLVLWGTINFVFGGKATFGSIFAVWFFADLPSILKVLLGIVVMFAGGTPETFNIKNFAPTNVAAFLPVMETNKAVYALANSLDIVTIWSLILLGMGVAIVAGVKRSSGYIAVFGWWALMVLIGVGYAAVMG